MATPQLYACACFFGTSTLSFVGFYGFAVLLAMIIGQAAAMPAVYVILNFTSSVLYYSVQSLLSEFVYGMSNIYHNFGSVFYRLSPIAYIMTNGLSVLPGAGLQTAARIFPGIFFPAGAILPLWQAPGPCICNPRASRLPPP